MNAKNIVKALRVYDIVAAFDHLDVIEWSQSTNTTVGDTVYI